MAKKAKKTAKQTNLKANKKKQETNTKKPKKSKKTKKASVYEPYKIYLYDVSYFSGKIEMYLRYKEIPFERYEIKASELYEIAYKNTGVMKVPFLNAANGDWFKDSTPMIDWFEKQYSRSNVIPEDPVLFFLSKLVEDYADEWLWRPAMYYRWQYDHRYMGRRLGREILDFKKAPFPAYIRGRFMAARQKLIFMRNDGVTAKTRPAIEAIYLKNIQALERILQDSPYLLGNRPTLADFGYMGSMFRHFSLDPTSARIMREQAPGVYEWIARMWNRRASEFNQKAKLNRFAHPGWEHILRDICRVYLPFLKENALAFRDGKKYFDFDAGDACYKKIKVVQYRAWCREVLQEHFENLPAKAQRQVQKILDRAGGLAALFEKGKIDSGLQDEFDLPLRLKAKKISLWNLIKVKADGTPWDMPEPE